MSLFAPTDSVKEIATQTRRALIVVDAGESVLAPLLAAHGYEVETTSLTLAAYQVNSGAPDLIILEL